MESRIWVWGKNHFAGSLYDTIVRVGGQVVKELIGSLISDLSSRCLLITYVIEGH